MAYSEILADRIRELLVDVPRVQEKKMFRGVTFMVNNKMCVSVSNNRLMCRVDPAMHETLVENDGCQTVNMRGRDLKGWIYIDEDFVKTERALKHWVNLALDFNKFAKASAKSKSARSSKKNKKKAVPTKPVQKKISKKASPKQKKG